MLLVRLVIGCIGCGGGCGSDSWFWGLLCLCPFPSMDCGHD